MLCSISTGKSGSTWLDRLRSSKGFPVQTGLDLEHFLNPNPTSKVPTNPIPEENPTGSNHDATLDGEKSTVDRKKKTSSNPTPPMMIGEKNNEDWFDIMSSVLSELFNMGDSSRIRALDARRKKSSRKQSNPRICPLSTSASVDDSCLAGVPAMSPSSVDNSVAEVKESRKQGIAESINPEDEILQAVTVDSDLSAFSRAEVTIIDTSAPAWKSEKLIYRKGSVWKIRDKKRNSWNALACRKKRKLGQRDGDGGEEKQQKSSFLPSNSFKEADSEEHLISSNEAFKDSGEIKFSFSRNFHHEVDWFWMCGDFGGCM